MTNVETDQLAWMRQQKLCFSYKPGWDLTIDHDRGRPVLVARYTAPDSRNPNYPRGVQARRRLQPTTDLRALAEDILAQLDDIERHETREWLRCMGELVADPHTDPSRWHCPCGGVGPVRRGNTWTCPGCNTNRRAEES